MDLLAFARGPALAAATAILILGLAWRLVGLALLRFRPELSEARDKAAWKGLLLTATRSTPKREFEHATLVIELLGYTFHFGLFAVVLFFAPHVLLLVDVIKAFVPAKIGAFILAWWPTLPGGLLYFLTSVSVACLLVLIIHRLANPVKRLISNFDDYMSWLMTIAPLVTGMVAHIHPVNLYPQLLAAHILSVEALMIWFPFGKLMHTVFMIAMRGATGVVFTRKGAAL
jgi:nitrate reductase gamma subunit